MKRIILSILAASGLMSAQAAIYQYSVFLDGPSEIPVTPSLGTGLGSVVYNDIAHTLQLQVTFSGLITTSGNGVTVSHIHAATLNPFSGTANVAVTSPSLPGFPTAVFSGSYSNTLDLTLASSWNPNFVTANGGTIAGAESALAAAMASGRAYWNIHTQAHGPGEIRGFLVAVPEPSSLALASVGGLACWLGCRRKRDE